ncbi:hypothetical protein [Paracoccus alkanivorans]|uniref:Uncharacterized protein n=1 Tax=Paracoccus alkanivorans TaxID=2116655 RepID=A0A3M0MG80_9RHOB|nr:hypothetical protein [Paracoccus alkanivorans]RMC35354.1 hypothetical protein C9E81_08920 [Paracoccus alkanivorans]
MTFIPSDQLLNDPVRVNVLANDKEHIARVLIGQDDHTEEVYSAVVTLISQPQLPAGTLELMFGIVVYDPELSEPEWINDGEATKRFLKDEDRVAVLECICSMAVEVARAADPSVITFVTSVPYLPQKALTKYGYICKALRGVGYFGGRGNEYLGSHVWMLEKRQG